MNDYALKELHDIRSNFNKRLKQARATHDDHMVAILGRRVSALDAAIAALEQSTEYYEGYEEGMKAQVPEGWKLVPAIPTDDMIHIARRTSGANTEGIIWIYQNMLAAAPTHHAKDGQGGIISSVVN